jgi:hypothetical protein
VAGTVGGGGARVSPRAAPVDFCGEAEASASADKRFTRATPPGRKGQAPDSGFTPTILDHGIYV